MKTDTYKGAFQERIKARIMALQEKAPGKISKRRKIERSFQFFKSLAFPAVK